eukprot:TRINITY_DN28302_c0_g1_i1.p1 TRINITY_DN28302_c0_g1~~TRINITY_DN28302_c0_g1_i1.p1  ORF type:complete len:200 (-),score=26.73 TRINITY_DN28302_c0_g1_i1:66-665(-)
MANLENQPFWAKKLLKTEEEQDDEADNAASAEMFKRASASIRDQNDLLNLVRGGEGCGILISRALSESYSTALQDIHKLLRTNSVRSVHAEPKEERYNRKWQRGRSSSSSALPDPPIEEPQEYPFGEVMFPRFEPEVEAILVDDDVRQAFHSTLPPQQGDVATRLAPQKQETGPKKKRTRTSKLPRKVSNVHMYEGGAG